MTPNRAAFVQWMIEAISRWRVDLVIPVTDAAILPLSEERDRLPPACRVAMPEPEPLRVVTDKRRTLELASRLGIPTPRSVLVDSAEAAREAAGDLGWPVVLKPMSSRVYRDRKSVEAFEVSDVMATTATAGASGPIAARAATPPAPPAAVSRASLPAVVPVPPSPAATETVAPGAGAPSTGAPRSHWAHAYGHTKDRDLNGMADKAELPGQRGHGHDA